VKKPYALADYEVTVRELMATRPDLTLDELYRELAARGIDVGRSSGATVLPTAGSVDGTYFWDVSYNGDGSNNAVTASLERVTVGATPLPAPRRCSPPASARSVCSAGAGSADPAQVC
jgi:hypothetical protein